MVALMKGVAAGMVRRARIWDIYRRRDPIGLDVL